jgi:hypothetical protein
MPIENHQEIQLLIDKSLSGEILPEEEKSLLEHLHACAECREYKANSTRVVAALDGFTFEVTPDLNAKVQRSIQQLVVKQEAAKQEQRQMRIASISAFLLSFLGSSVVWPASDFLAARFQISAGAMQFGLLFLWVAPSLLISLLLPVISKLLLNHEAQKGWTS